MRKLKRSNVVNLDQPRALRQNRRARNGSGQFLGGTPVTSRISIVLDQTTSGVTEDASWVQVASQGEFRGYAGGTKSFTFDAQVFNMIVNNFRRHPSYKKGPDGIGCEDIIAWDFHHASEMDPTQGTIPVTGVPAQAWIRELAIRQNPENQEFELWALTHWLEPAKTFVREGRYKWASVSVVFDAIDARTAVNIGPILTSVALTNQPFIEGMQKLAAERWRNGMYIECADSAEDALEMIRSMLALPGTADAATVMAELDKVKTWLATGSTPVGVELDDIVGDLRTILNLPALSSADEVFVEVAKLVSRLGTESGVEGGQVNPPTPAPPAGTQIPGGQANAPQPPASPPAMPLLEKRTMDLIKTLASKLGVVATPEAIAEAADHLVELRGTVAKNVGLTATTANNVLLKAILDDASVRAKYVPLLSALGVENPDAALDKIATMMADSAKLAEITPEFAALKTKASEEEAAVADEDVEAAVETTGVTAESEHFDGMKIALSTLRKTDRKKFDEKYPKEKLDAARKAIAARKAGSSTIVATSRNVDVTTLTRKIAATGNQQSGAGAGGGEGGQIDVSQFEGANTILRTCSYVKASVAGAKDWSWDKVHEHATTLVRSKAVTG
jgi:hypothetical protein